LIKSDSRCARTFITLTVAVALLFVVAAPVLADDTQADLVPEMNVFVKLSDAPAYQITEVGENVVQVELQNTRVKRANDTRFMDTSFFASPVAMVTPKRQGTSYVVEIRLKQKVPWQQKVEGEMLAIDFERPVSMREKPVPAAAAPEGAAPAPGAAPAEPQAQPPAPAAEPAPKSD